VLHLETETLKVYHTVVNFVSAFLAELYVSCIGIWLELILRYTVNEWCDYVKCFVVASAFYALCVVGCMSEKGIWCLTILLQQMAKVYLGYLSETRLCVENRLVK